MALNPETIDRFLNLLSLYFSIRDRITGGGKIKMIFMDKWVERINTNLIVKKTRYELQTHINNLRDLFNHSTSFSFSNITEKILMDTKCQDVEIILRLFRENNCEFSETDTDTKVDGFDPIRVIPRMTRRLQNCCEFINALSNTNCNFTKGSIAEYKTLQAKWLVFVIGGYEPFVKAVWPKITNENYAITFQPLPDIISNANTTSK